MRDMDGLAAYLGVSKSLIKKKVALGEWPCHRIGRLVRFTDDDVAAIEAATAQPALNPYTKASR